MSKLRRIMHVAGWVLGVGSLGLVLSSAISRSNDALLTNVRVEIKQGEDNPFVAQEEVLEMISDFGYKPGLTALTEINPGAIERALEQRAFVKNAEVYKELNGSLHAIVVVRQPVLRVYNLIGQSIYIDESGWFVPVSSHAAARTPIANGWISMNFAALPGRNVLEDFGDNEPLDMEVIRELYCAASICNKDRFWKSQFVQFHLNSHRDIELIPRVGDHIIVIGSTANLEKKLNKLRLFYSEALTKTGWNEYKVINLKYANQVVCRKSNV